MYERAEYVWPHVKELREQRHFEEGAPPAHLKVMRAFLVGFDGICNFNYKVRPSGAIAIFEVNTRVGGDLAADAPRWRARELLEKLDRSEVEVEVDVHG